MMGVSVSSFMIEQAYQKALELINHSQAIALNADEWQQAIELLENPPKPNDKLQALFARGYRVVNQ